MKVQFDSNSFTETHDQFLHSKMNSSSSGIPLSTNPNCSIFHHNTIFIKLLEKTLTLDVHPESISLENLNQEIHHKYGIPTHLQRLFCCSRRLIAGQHTNSIADLGVVPNSTLTLHIPLLGGKRSTVSPKFTSTNPPAGDTRPDRAPEEDDDNLKFDEIEGSDVGLFASALHDDEDDKEERVAKLKQQEIEMYGASNPHFLPTSIPEIGESSLVNQKGESFVPVPNTLLMKSRQEKDLDLRDLTAFGEAKRNILALKLDKLSESVSGLTRADPMLYLPTLQNTSNTSNVEELFGGIKESRLILKSVIKRNPKCPRGWIAAAQLEERAGMIHVARKLIEKGCEECPRSEDIWIEASRLSSQGEAKAIIARGLKVIPNSVKLWLQASKLEQDYPTKSRILRKGLMQIRNSIQLWKAVVDVSNNEDARILLHKAVQFFPLDVEFWISLSRLEPYDNAKKVLSKAREKLPHESAIWITEAKLEESNSNTALVRTIINRGFMVLQRQGLAIDRASWMKEAEAAERSGSVETCNAIISNTIGIGVEVEDRKRTWVADAEECKKRGSIETARAIYEHALKRLSTKKSIWLKSAQLEKSHGTKETLDALYSKAVAYNPRAEVLWLMWAEEKRLTGDVPAARTILEAAYAAMPDSEEICRAAFKLEMENNEPERARKLLAKAREEGGRERIWMKYAVLEEVLGNEGLKKEGGSFSEVVKEESSSGDEKEH